MVWKDEFKWISEHINKIIVTSCRLYVFKRHELKNKNEANVRESITRSILNASTRKSSKAYLPLLWKEFLDMENKIGNITQELVLQEVDS